MSRMITWKQVHKREANARYRYKIRQMIFDHYGWNCAYRNADCQGGPEIDHKHGDGAERRTAVLGEPVGGGWNYYRAIIKAGFPDIYQTICRYHNVDKGTTPDSEYDPLASKRNPIDTSWD